MMEQCLNVYVDLNSPSNKSDGGEFPDPAELARRYGVDNDEDSASDREDDEEEERRKQERLAKQAEAESRIGAPELLGKVKQLTGKLTEKNKEIDRLCCLLEAMEPIPGIDPEKFLKLYAERDQVAAAAGVKPDLDLGVDYRDSKIVALAKKVRKVTMLLNKERATAGGHKQAADELRGKVEKMQKELDALASPAARAAALRNMRADIRAQDSEHDAAEVRQQLAAANKAAEEAKRKAAAAEAENKKLHRALARELGEAPGGAGDEGSRVAAAMDENSSWRGRAQQILALKSKVGGSERSLRTVAQMIICCCWCLSCR